MLARALDKSACSITKTTHQSNQHNGEACIAADGTCLFDKGNHNAQQQYAYVL
jgi:hypothetical protein